MTSGFPALPANRRASWLLPARIKRSTALFGLLIIVGLRISSRSRMLLPSSYARLTEVPQERSWQILDRPAQELQIVLPSWDVCAGCLTGASFFLPRKSRVHNKALTTFGRFRSTQLAANRPISLRR